MNKSWLFLFCAIFWTVVLSEKWPYLNICVISSYTEDDIFSELCRRVTDLSDNATNCVYSADRIGCLEHLMQEKADIAVLKAEDLLLVSHLAGETVNDLVITNEFRLFTENPYEYDMVVLVSNNYEIKSLNDLRDKRLCHPGYDEHNSLDNWSDVFAQYFEQIVVPEECNSNLSVFENKVRSLEMFFGSSCKPGYWSLETNVDERLKQRYSNLCKTCNIPSSCAQRDLYWGRTGPLLCITDCKGDVAWVRLQDAKLHFKTQLSSCRNLSYLCQDGTIQPLSTEEPCIWISHPWPLIVTRKSISDEVTKLITRLNTSPMTFKPGTWEYAVRKVLNPISYQSIYSIPTTPMKDYLDRIPGFMRGYSMSSSCKGTKDDKNITVCVKDEEVLKKCELMAEMAHVYSVDPEFVCLMSDDCLTSVETYETDVTVVNSDYLKEVYMRKGLKALLYQSHFDYIVLRQVTAIVKKSSNIQVLKDLKGKKACFIRENGFDWNAFLMVLVKNELIEDICDWEHEMKNFFSDICIIDSKPGDKFRSCFPYDSIPDIGNRFSNGAQSLHCVVDGGGDVAFMDFRDLFKYIDAGNFSSTITEDTFRKICPQTSSSYECYLSFGSFGQVVINANVSTSREEEIISAFLLLNSLFGERYLSSQLLPTYKIFARYEKEKDLFFESQTTKLDTYGNFMKRGNLKKYNYEMMIKKAVDVCLSKKKMTNNSVISCPVMYIYFYQILFITCVFYLSGLQ